MRLAAGALVFVISGCAVTDPRDPPLFGPPQEPQQSGEQAETDAVLAETPEGNPVVVVGHRYTGPSHLNNDEEQPFDIVYGGSNDAGVAFLRGSSIMGWSYSLNGGLAWEAPGKIYPENGVFGDPVAVLWSDPALASGFVNRSLVAYASLAGSTQAFNAVTGGTDTADILFGWPPSVDRPDFPGPDDFGIIDSLCVAVSFDGGINFERPVCKRPAGIGASGTDQTTVAIGAGDRIYVAVDDFSNEEVRLFELIYTGEPAPFLSPISMPAEMIGFQHGPELRRDQDGFVWLAAVDGLGSIAMCLVTSSGCQFIGSVTTGTDFFATVPGGIVSPEPLRSGSSADFGVNRVSLDGLTVREFIFAYTRQDAQREITGLTRCFLFSIQGTLSCEDVAAWGSASRAGQHLQPNIEFVDKSPEQDGSGADWRYAFYEFDRPDVAQGHAQVTLGRMSGALPSTLAPSVTFFPLTALDPEVCPADYPTFDYWGDYFALLALPPIAPSTSWRHMAAYSSDESRGCAPAHPRQGRHLHVVAWSWQD
ncbi:MAG: hypothetical protein U0263_38070 [Polyangiaceae bacterium]